MLHPGTQTRRLCGKCALILLCAFQAQRIRHLTADQLTQKGGDAYLTAGRHPMLLPPRLGALLRELASRPPAPLMIPHGPNTPSWLFPGRVHGQPIDGHSLTNPLNRHGISARPAHNGVLAALAADLPAAILADLLGLHVNTAVRWVVYARRDWADHLAIRAAEQKENGGETEAGKWSESHPCSNPDRQPDVHRPARPAKH